MAQDNTPTIYHIRLQGHLQPQWSDWFDGLSVTLAESGITVLHGPIADQATLHGVLRKVRDLGLPLLAVVRIAPEQEDI